MIRNNPNTAASPAQRRRIHAASDTEARDDEVVAVDRVAQETEAAESVSELEATPPRTPSEAAEDYMATQNRRERPIFAMIMRIKPCITFS